jgi:hypothetical protein
MNKLRRLICAAYAACALVLVGVGTTVVKADSGNFAGPYIGLNASAYGIGAKGKSITGVDNIYGSGVNNATVGKAAGVVGGEIGYVVPLGSLFLIDIGASMLAGEAMFEVEGDDSGSDDVQFTINDLVTFYISPQLALSDTSSVYVKVGLAGADTGVKGDVTTPSQLSGTTWALGLRTVLESGIFIRSEAGFTEWNGISAHGKGSTGGIATSNTYSAELDSAYGMISMGMRF